MNNARKTDSKNRPRSSRWHLAAGLTLLLLAGGGLLVISDPGGPWTAKVAPEAAQLPPAPDDAARQSHAPSIAHGPALDHSSPADSHQPPAGALAPTTSSEPVSAASPARFTGDRAETERFIDHERDIALTPEQEQVRVAALTPLPAPCCKNFSAATCCCRCNMAKATWGLAKHLIVDERAGAEQVRSAVAEWHRAINPGGFSGDACFAGGCSRAFAQNGCGGMEQGHLVF